MGNLVFQATLGGQVNLVGPNTASTFNLNVPAVSSTISTTSGTETLTNKTITTPVINGFTGDTSVVNIGSGQFYKDTSGNIGVGVTPNTWTDYKAIEIGAVGSSFFGASNEAGVLSNAYWNSAFKYAASSIAATRYSQTSGQHRWYNAPSGTAGGTITFTQAMTLTAAGDFGLGTTSPTVNSGWTTMALNSATNGGLLEIQKNGTRTFLIYNPAGSSDTLITTNSTTALQLGTNGSERARIDSSGNLLVGMTSYSVTNAGASLSPTASSSFYVAGGTALTVGRGTSDGTAVQFNRSGTNVGSISVTTTATAYNTSSDYRLKNITGGLTGYKERLSALQPKQGSWKVDGSEFRGFLAHEFSESYPSSVNGEKDAVDENGNPQYQGMQAGSSEVIADLVAYVKELETRLTALENK